MTVLVLDIGSSSARALLFDDLARPIPGAVVQRHYQMTTTPPGAAVLDAAALREVVEATIDGILLHPSAGEIRVVGLATFVGNLVGLNAARHPITPVYLYADTRSADDVETLRAQIDAVASHERTGCPLHTAYHPARLRWLASAAPETYAQVAQWVDFASYLYTCWFGQTACSYSVASWSGLLNRATLQWDGEWLRTLGISPTALPVLRDYDSTARILTPSYQTRWHALSAVPFCLAVGDGAAANIGTGCCDSTRLAMSLGTTAALRVTYPQPQPSGIAGAQRAAPDPAASPAAAAPSVPYSLWSYRVSADLHLIGGATSEGGNLYRWARQTLLLPDSLTDALSQRPVDGHGLTVLPLLAGERSPGWSPDATGTITGLRLSTTPLDIAQALFEGLALRLAIIFEQLGSFIGVNAELIASGGALSPYLAGTIASALDQPVNVTEDTEITARGVAMLALRAVGVNVRLNEAPAVAYTAEPQPDAVKLLRKAKERQQALYRTMIEKNYSTD